MGQSPYSEAKTSWTSHDIHRFLLNPKVQGKIHPITCHIGTKGSRHSSTLSLTSALDADVWSTSRTAAVPPGMTRYPLYRRLNEPQGRSGRVRKISLPPGFDTRTAQPVASRYTDRTITAHRAHEYNPVKPYAV